MTQAHCSHSHPMHVHVLHDMCDVANFAAHRSRPGIDMTYLSGFIIYRGGGQEKHIGGHDFGLDQWEEGLIFLSSVGGVV